MGRFEGSDSGCWGFPARSQILLFDSPFPHKCWRKAVYTRVRRVHQCQVTPRYFLAFPITRHFSGKKSTFRCSLDVITERQKRPQGTCPHDGALWACLLYQRDGTTSNGKFNVKPERKHSLLEVAPQEPNASIFGPGQHLRDPICLL